MDSIRFCCLQQEKQKHRRQSGDLKRMSHQWEKKQVVSKSKINVSAWPAAPWRKPECRKVKSTVRKQKVWFHTVTFTNDYRKKKGNSGRKHREEKKKAIRLTSFLAGWLLGQPQHLGSLWSLASAMFVMSHAWTWLWSLSLHFTRLWGLRRSRTSTSADTRFYIRGKQGQAIQFTATGELIDEDNKHTICHFTTSFVSLENSISWLRFIMKEAAAAYWGKNNNITKVRTVCSEKIHNVDFWIYSDTSKRLIFSKKA